QVVLSPEYLLHVDHHRRWTDEVHRSPLEAHPSGEQCDLTTWPNRARRRRPTSAVAPAMRWGRGALVRWLGDDCGIDPVMMRQAPEFIGSHAVALRQVAEFQLGVLRGHQ